MSGFSFSVSAITVKQGEAVTWTNNDNVHHTCTSDNGTWDSGDLAPGHSFSYTFNASGTYHYSCTYHKSMGMVAVVIVTPTQQ
jgi:plastocyanin